VKTVGTSQEKEESRKKFGRERETQIVKGKRRSLKEREDNYILRKKKEVFARSLSTSRERKGRSKKRNFILLPGKKKRDDSSFSGRKSETIQILSEGKLENLSKKRGY